MIKQGMVSVACPKTVGAKSARCRNRVLMQIGIPSTDGASRIACDMHRKFQNSAAPMPTVVSLKMRIGGKRMQQLLGSGASFASKPRSFRQDNQNHTAHAKDAGVDAHKYRNAAADSGTEVLQSDADQPKRGLMDATINGIPAQLESAGFVLVSYEIQPVPDWNNLHPKEPMFTFARVYSLEQGAVKVELPADVRAYVAELDGSVWEFVHVWANPISENGATIHHTVNTAHRLTTPPQAVSLVFEPEIAGYWWAQNEE